MCLFLPGGGLQNVFILNKKAVMKPGNQLRLVPSVVKSATMSVDVKVEAWLVQPAVAGDA